MEIASRAICIFALIGIGDESSIETCIIYSCLIRDLVGSSFSALMCNRKNELAKNKKALNDRHKKSFNAC
jgi:hypothetical protein